MLERNACHCSGQNPVYIIIDAIDECPDIPGVPSPREDTLEFVKELVELRLPKFAVVCHQPARNWHPGRPRALIPLPPGFST